MLAPIADLQSAGVSWAAHDEHWVAALLDGAPLAISSTALPAHVLQHAEQLSRAQPRSFREAFQTRSLESLLRSAFAHIGAQRAIGDEMVSALIMPLLQALDTLAVQHGTLRLEIVHTQACPKLHVDHLRWRLCCTLAGAATEYLPAGRSPSDNEIGLVEPMPAGVLVGMAGALSGQGLWHRSPHACADHPRLFLSLDVG